jgi:cob(I)alamin adenosyltransferase
MGMYTRRGDRGETSLYGPRRVKKDSPRVEAYGTIDELNSLIGVVIAETEEKKVASDLKRVQRMLFVAGADSAAELERSAKVPRISAAETATLEKMTDDLLAELPVLQNFVLPGGNPAAARLQLARAVCRRAERRLVTASRKEAMNGELLPFFNRLSSYLFNLARWVNLKSGGREEVWKP